VDKPGSHQKRWCPYGWAPTEIEIDLRVAGRYRIGMRDRESGHCFGVRPFPGVHTPERLGCTHGGGRTHFTYARKRASLFSSSSAEPELKWC
jgi:hypothetical protein